MRSNFFIYNLKRRKRFKCIVWEEYKEKRKEGRKREREKENVCIGKEWIIGE